jgi:hypothetical protein
MSLAELRQIRLFKFIRVDGGVAFMKHVKGGESYKSLGNSALDTRSVVILTVKHFITPL